MKIIENIKKGVLQGIGISLVLGLFGISYATWSLLPTESDGESLNAAKWNDVIDRLNSIDEKALATAWVHFSGENCTGGSGNECTINDSYNISSVVRNSAGNYTVYFSTPMSNDNYNGNVTCGGPNTDNGHRIGLFGGFPLGGVGYHKSVNSFNIASGYYNNFVYDASEISVQIFGGKTY